jgi:hypothetical protein
MRKRKPIFYVVNTRHNSVGGHIDDAAETWVRELGVLKSWGCIGRWAVFYHKPAALKPGIPFFPDQWNSASGVAAGNLPRSPAKI